MRRTISTFRHHVTLNGFRSWLYKPPHSVDSAALSISCCLLLPHHFTAAWVQFQTVRLQTASRRGLYQLLFGSWVTVYWRRKWSIAVSEEERGLCEAGTHSSDLLDWYWLPRADGLLARQHGSTLDSSFVRVNLTLFLAVGYNKDMYNFPIRKPKGK